MKILVKWKEVEVRDLDASQFVNCKHDNIEPVDWACVNKNWKLWHCTSIAHCKVLVIANEKSLYPNVSQNIIQNYSGGHPQHSYQVLGFVTALMSSNILTTFHIHIFLLYKKDKGRTVVVFCMVTSRHCDHV